MSEGDFEMIKSFEIDNGELDELTRQECFVFGYELSMIDTLLRRDAAFEKPVNAGNADRIEKTCKDSGRKYTMEWMNDDWKYLRVASR